jgi:hypothetical protein
VLSLTVYRTAFDPIQEKNHAFYRDSGSRWIYESAKHTNYSTYIINTLRTILDKVLGDKTLPTIDRAFVDATKALKLRLERDKHATTDLEQMANRCMHSDDFYRENGVSTPSEFYAKLDSVRHLVGFNNGILDLRAMVFHTKREPEMYVSFTTGYDFIGDASCEPTSDEAKAAMEAVEAEYAKYHPDAAIRKSVQFILAFALGAGTLKEKQVFASLWGEQGSNGKSSFMEWIQQTFGNQYMRVMAGEYLTRVADDADKPNSGLVHISKTRIARVDEMSKNHTINNETMKRFSGGDPIPMRGLYGNTEGRVIDAVIFMIMNSLPAFKVEDESAIVRRHLFLPFEARFSEKQAALTRTATSPRPSLTLATT